MLSEGDRALLCVESGAQDVRSSAIEFKSGDSDTTAHVTWVKLSCLMPPADSCSRPLITKSTALHLALAVENMSPEVFESPAEEDN